MYDKDGVKTDITSYFDRLEYEETCGFSALVKLPDKTLYQIRVCIKRKDKESCEKSLIKLRRRNSKKQQTLGEDTIRFNEFIVVVTSMPESVSAEDIMETYRYRWQVELYFKRLKSIMDYGELPKKSESSSMSWLNGKIMVAILIELYMAKYGKEVYFPSSKPAMIKEVSGEKQSLYI
jgi:IS4 transposase